MANAVILPGERLAGLSADLFHKLQAGSLTLDEFALFTQRKNPFEICVPTTDVFRLTVDYGQSLEQMIAAGHYDWKNSDINAKLFPIEGQGNVEFEAKIFHFNRGISSGSAIGAIEDAHWEPAKIEHLLAFGEKYPDEQHKFPIVVLGSVAEVRGGRGAPCLSRGGSRRRLDLIRFDEDWDAYDRFLAVREVSTA